MEKRSLIQFAQAPLKLHELVANLLRVCRELVDTSPSSRHDCRYRVNPGPGVARECSESKPEPGVGVDPATPLEDPPCFS